MALMGFSAPAEIGLRLLLNPLGSKVLIRTACCTVGFLLPAYSTFKAIEKKDEEEKQRWLVYWSAYGAFGAAEVFSDRILSWVPLYYHIKFGFLIWLQLPSTNGAKQLYERYLRPFLLKHQTRLDQLTGLIYGETNKFIQAHQTQVKFLKSLLAGLISGGRGIGPPESSLPAIEPERNQTEDSVSDGD